MPVLNFQKPRLKSKMNINKLQMYMPLCQAILRGADKPSNTRTIRAFVYICVRLVSSAPWYISDIHLH